MKVLILVLSLNDSADYSNLTVAQKNTWDSINVDNVKTFYLFGNHIKNEIIDNNIFVNVHETIFNCGQKTIESLEVINSMDFDYIFRVNSSSYVDKELMIKYLLDKPREKYYSGVIGNYNNIKYASGSGYFLSHDLVNLILQNKSKWNHNYIDDVALGLLLKEHEISPLPAPRCDLEELYIPNNYYHYRSKKNNTNRSIDALNFHKIFKIKFDNNE